MRRHLLWGAVLGAATLTMSAVHAQAEDFRAKLSGFNELGALNAQTGAILTDGTGTAEVDLDESNQTATYTLTVSDLSAPVTQAHIHFGKARDSGGVMVFFCTNLGNGPMGTPACPAGGGTVTGMWTAASVVAIPGQNVTARNFTALERALESNTAYANVHTTNFPAGEIRGQMRHERERERDR